MERSSRDSTQLEEEIDRIVTLAATYPDAAARVALRFIADEGRLACFGLFCETIGVECARLLFDSLPEYAWKLLDAWDGATAPLPLGRAIEAFASALLDECMEEPESRGTDSTQNPFAFLSGKPDERLAQALTAFPIERVALIGLFQKRDEIAWIAKALGPAAAKRLIVTISRLHRVPRAVILGQARQFADELQDKLDAEEPSPAVPIALEMTAPEPAAAEEPAKALITDLDRAIAAIDLDRELEILAQAAGRSQRLDDIIRTLPSSEPIRAIVESARQKTFI